MHVNGYRCWRIASRRRGEIISVFNNCLKVGERLRNEDETADMFENTHQKMHFYSIVGREL
jgi:hypothetical protein